jgi:hypothetical protein
MMLIENHLTESKDDRGFTVLDCIFELLGYPSESNGTCILKYPEFAYYKKKRMRADNMLKLKPISKVFDHVVIDSALDLLKRLLALDPMERISAKEAL